MLPPFILGAWEEEQFLGEIWYRPLESDRGEAVGNAESISSSYAQERLRLCLSSIKMGVWDWDVSRDVLTWDRSLYELYGVHEEDFSGAFDAWESTVHPEDKERSLRELHAALRGESEFDTSFRVVTPTGETKMIAAKARVERDANGHAIRIMGVNWDVTKEHEQADTILAQQATLLHSEKMASLGEMASGMAHEINNPLAIIQSKVSRIQTQARRGEIDKDQLLNDLSQISATCLRISKIVNGLKSFSRNAQLDPFEPVSIKQLVTDTLSLCEQRFLNHHIPIELHKLEDALTLGRAAQLEQVLLNLLNNAFDAVVNTPNPWVKVHVEIAKSKVRVLVSDSGQGIPSAVARKMMEPFFTTKPVGKGTGLGLSIARGIMENHKGVLRFEPHAAHTTFVMELPRFRDNKPA